MNTSATACAIGGVLIFVEWLLLRVLRRERIVWAELVFNLNSGHILMWVFRGVEIAAYALVLSHLNLHWVDRWPVAAQWLFAVFAWDLCFYWRHRAHHRIAALWSVHVVHHQGEHFSLSLCNRNSWYSSLTDFPFTGVLAVLGLPLDIYVAVSSFHYAVQFFNHCGLVKSAGILDRFFVTPRHHRVHHRAETRYFDRNFGGTFLIWDKLFGTFTQADPRDAQERFGVDGIANSRNPLRASNEPILQRLGLRWPARSRLRAPRRALGGDDVFVGAGGLLLYALLVAWLDLPQSVPAATRSLLLACTLAGTIALGMHCDGQRRGTLGWILLALTMPVLWFDPWTAHDALPLAFAVLAALFAAHGALGLLNLLRGLRESASPSRG